MGLHVLVTQRAGLLPPEDQAELAHFERCLDVGAMGDERVLVSRYDAAGDDEERGGGGLDEDGVTQRVLDVCKHEQAHLIMLGAASTEAAGGMDTPTAAAVARARPRSSVPHGVEIDYRKRLLSAKLGQVR